MEFTDRYQALGMPYPDPQTMCKGQCEGTGVYPVALYTVPPAPGEIRPADESLTDAEIAAWRAAEAEHPNEPGDVWHFVKCADCGGTGKTR